MKELLEKMLPLFEKLKGKKTKVVVLSVVIIGALYLGVHYGIISSDLVNLDNIIGSVETLVGDTTKDTLTQPVVDTIQVIKDSL